MNIRFRPGTGAESVLRDVDASWTVARLKSEYCAAVGGGLTPDRVRFIFLGRVLKDDSTLAEHKMANDQVVHVVSRPPDVAAPPAASSTTSGATAAPPSGASSSAANSGAGAPPPSSSSTTPGTGVPPLGTGLDHSAAANLFRVFESLQGLTGVAAAGGAAPPAGGATPSATAGAANGTATSTTTQVGPDGETTTTTTTTNLAGTDLGSIFGMMQGAIQTAAHAVRTRATAGGLNMGGVAAEGGAAAGAQPSQGDTSPPAGAQGGADAAGGASSTAPSATAATSSATQQQQQQFFMRPVVAPAVQVHVHVTLEELDSLPARLAQFYQRVQLPGPPPGMTIHTPGQPPRPAPGQPPQPSIPTATAATMGARAASSSSSTTTSAAPGGTAAPPSAAPQATGPASNFLSRIVAEAASAANAVRGATQPRPSVSQLAATAGVADNGPSQSIFDELQVALMSTMDVPDVMRMLQGDWTPTERTRDPLLKYIVKARGEGVADSPAERDKIALNTARGVRQQAAEHNQLSQQLASRSKDGVATLDIFQAFVASITRRLQDLVIDGPSPAGTMYSANLRAVVVKGAGHMSDYFKREVFRNGQVDVDAVVAFGVQTTLQKVVQEHPEFAMAAMAGPMIQQFIKGWATEYATRLKSPQDDEDVLAWLPKIRSAAGAATAAASPSHNLDDLLDAALSESDQTPNAATVVAQSNDTAASAPLSGAAAAAARSIEANVVDPSARAELLQQLRAFVALPPPAPPGAAYFAAFPEPKA